jgi:hypothetical protein
MDYNKFETAFNEFFKLKHLYEEKINKAKTIIIKNPNLNSQEKREKFKSLRKKCINCGKEGGTNFKIYDNILEAKCIASTPCNLHIKLQRAKTKLLNNYDEELYNEIMEKKSKIIINKLNYLYGYETEKNTLVKFNIIKSELMKLIKDYEIINTYYNNILDNQDKIKIIREKKDELFILIENMKKLIKQYLEEENDTFLKEGLEIYINYIQPITKELLNIKYSNNSLIIEEKDKTIYKLIQEPYTLKDITYSIIGQDNKILIYKK